MDFEKRAANDTSDFVLLSDFVPSIVQEIRYFSTYNFIGDRIDGYEQPVAIITKEAARALKAVSNEMNVKGYRLKIFDAYRPATAVKHFVLWGIEDLDQRMKPFFYPDLEKVSLFELGYIASKSSHSRGSTVDLTLLDMQTGKGRVSTGKYAPIIIEAMKKKAKSFIGLQEVLLRAGFTMWQPTKEGEEEVKPDIDFTNLEKDTLIQLLTK